MNLLLDIVRSAAMAFSCFSIIPVPQVQWREENMRYMMCLLPLVGVVIALLLVLWTQLSHVLGFGSLLFACGLAVIPLFVSGGIHMDGFCDVMDAQASHAEPARKREILKDPHPGAFAIMATVAYFLIYVSFASELQVAWRTALLVGIVHVMSRCLSGIATLAYPTNASKGMLSMFHESGKASALVALLLELAACIVVIAVIDVTAAFAMAAIALACFALLWPFAKTQFGGMGGDVAGFFLQVVELCMVMALVLTTKAVGL